MRQFLAAAAAVAFLSLLAAAPSQAADRCPNAETRGFIAKDVRTRGGLDCGVATVLVRSYLRKVDESGDRGCAKRRFTRAGCRIGDFTCFARVTDSGEIRDRCGEGRLRVKFREVNKHST